MTILSDVKALGQQIWLDNLSRSLIQSGELENMPQQGVCGVTSNPAIFQKAFAGDVLYADEISTLKQKDLSPKQRYEILAIADVQAACDVCRPEFDAQKGHSGFVSLEVAPNLAQDTTGTISEAKRLHAAIDRPNVLIKVPATDAGIEAMSELVAAGISINLTLLFSRQQTLKAYTAYVKGIEKRLDNQQPIEHIQVVASFFLSRVDNALDTTLPEHLRGKIAISLAKAAYRDQQAFFNTTAFNLLRTKGANPVRLLWASTGVKNPSYPDTLYIDSLIGNETINTVPDATLAAFIDHGNASNTLPRQTDEALSHLAELNSLGIDIEALAQRLQEDGLKQFEEAFDKLLIPLA